MGNNSISPKKVEFTKKDSQVIQLLLEGESNKQIAMHLGISTRAVEQHLTHIYEKLGVCSWIEAVIKLIHLVEKSGSSGVRS